MNDFFTWEMLATLAGCSVATGLLTQFLKGAIKIPTQWLSYGIAVVLLFAATLFTGGLTLSTGGIIPLNAVIIALSSNGAYSAIVRVNQE